MNDTFFQVRVKKFKKKKKKGGGLLPQLRNISKKGKKHHYRLKDTQKKRILAINEGVKHEMKHKKKTKRKAAIAKKGRFNILRIYRRYNNKKDCEKITKDMKYMDKKYKLGKTKNICNKTFKNKSFKSKNKKFKKLKNKKLINKKLINKKLKGGKSKTKSKIKKKKRKNKTFKNKSFKSKKTKKKKKSKKRKMEPKMKNGRYVFEDFPEFKPNLSPREMFKRGSFGGTYWRPIYSSVVNKNLKNIHKKYPKSWWKDIPEDWMIRSDEEYDKNINKYKVKVGTTLDFWEGKNWIKENHPYGWVHWYCDFFSGKRCNDDERQVSRWKKLAGHKGRFMRFLVTQILNKSDEPKNKKWCDISVSPKIRQVLQHWGYELTKNDYDFEYKRRGL